MLKPLLCFLLAFQVATGGGGAIRGVVLGTGDRPIASAEVIALPWPPPPGPSTEQPLRTLSDSDGSFALRDLPANGYRIRVTAAGYVWQEYEGAAHGRRGAGTGTVINVLSGRTLPDITIRLVAEGMITGRIMSADGSPLIGIEVSALRKTFDAYGRPVFTPEGERAVTNDRGEYRIWGLATDHYYIRAAKGPDLLGAAAQSLASFAPTYYPGVAEPTKASPVDLRSGTEVRDINISMPRPRTFRLRGRIIDPASPVPPKVVTVSVTPARSDYVPFIAGSNTAYKPDGTFEVAEEVAAGVYWVLAQLPAPTFAERLAQLGWVPGASVPSLPFPPMGATLVTVIDSDIENLEVIILRDLVIAGNLKIEGRPPSDAEAREMRVELRQLSGGRISSPVGEMTIGPDGSFTYKNLPVGELRLTVSGTPPGFYVKTARIGNIDALTQWVDLTKPPTSPLDIVLAQGADVTGTVTDSVDRPVPNQQVILIPDFVANRPDLYKMAATDSNGRFTIQGVAPGDYRAFAWQVIESYRYFDAEFVRDFVDSGARVRVEDSAVSAGRVKLIQ